MLLAAGCHGSRGARTPPPAPAKVAVSENGHAITDRQWIDSVALDWSGRRLAEQRLALAQGDTLEGGAKPKARRAGAAASGSSPDSGTPPTGTVSSTSYAEAAPPPGIRTLERADIGGGPSSLSLTTLGPLLILAGIGVLALGLLVVAVRSWRRASPTTVST